MKKAATKMLSVFLCILMILTGIIPAVAETPVMETVNVSWDLVPDTPVTILNWLPALEKLVPVTASVTDMEWTKNKKGNNLLSFTVNFAEDYEPTEEEITMIGLHKDKGVGALVWCVVDYTTGLSLEKKNKLGVTVKSKRIKKEVRQFKDADGNSFKQFKNLIYTVTIEYPEGYDGLCIGLVGMFEYHDEKQFWNGSIPFSKTCYYSKTNADISHFMRVTTPEADNTDS